MQATRQLAQRVVDTHVERIPEPARVVARQALLDFIGVAIAGAREPLADILAAEIDAEGGHPQAQLLGRPGRASLRQAALFNGSAGHAHDYDDVHTAMTGHPTVPVAPAVLALAEAFGRSGAEVIAAFCAGVDAECILGRVAGANHYARGWHATGTLGAFGAAAAAARLRRLNVEETAAALGIAGTQAAGLKAQFGTMCKPAACRARRGHRRRCRQPRRPRLYQPPGHSRGRPRLSRYPKRARQHRPMATKRWPCRPSPRTSASSITPPVI